MNTDKKSTYGTADAVEAPATKGSRRLSLVVGFAAAACFTLGFLVASVGPSATQGLRGTALYVKDESKVWSNEGGIDNVDVGDVPAGGCVGGGVTTAAGVFTADTTTVSAGLLLPQPLPRSRRSPSRAIGDRRHDAQLLKAASTRAAISHQNGARSRAAHDHARRDGGGRGDARHDDVIDEQ